MPDYASGRELTALQTFTSEWEHRSKVRAGDLTFSSLLSKGWIQPFAGYNPNGDRYSITDLGREVLRLGPAPKVRAKPRLKTLAPVLRELKPRL
jgi:hypothetical protein